MLSIDGLVTGYGRDQVIRGVSLAIPERTITAVFGHNGAGKSSLVRALVGLIPVWQGHICLDGRDVSALSSRARVAAGLAVSFQDEAVFPTLSIRANLRLGAHLRWSDRAFLAERTEHVLTLFPKLRDRYEQAAYSLSGGERRMLSIGMALMSDPKLIVLDEPSTGLSPGLTEFVLQTVADIRDVLGKSVILVEQNVQHTMAVADHVIILKTGRVIFDGTPRALQEFGNIIMMF